MSKGRISGAGLSVVSWVTGWWAAVMGVWLVVALGIGAGPALGAAETCSNIGGFCPERGEYSIPCTQCSFPNSTGPGSDKGCCLEPKACQPNGTQCFCLVKGWFSSWWANGCVGPDGKCGCETTDRVGTGSGSSGSGAGGSGPSGTGTGMGAPGGAGAGGGGAGNDVPRKR